jgi:hypothetical protein
MKMAIYVKQLYGKIKMKKTKSTLIRLDEETHRRLKVFCAERQITVQELLIGLIQKELKK